MSQQRIRIRIRAFDSSIIDKACSLIIETIEETGSIFRGPVPLPTNIEKFTVNKSTFINKASKEQFEMRTHNRLIDIDQCTPKTIEALSNINLMAGVDVEIKMLTYT